MTLPMITIVGNLVSEPNLAFTPAGAARCSFRVAANDRKKDQTTGQWIDGDTTFIGVTAWRWQAEAAADELTKGTKVIIQGRLKSRSVEDEARGKSTTYYEVEADTIGVIVGNKDRSSNTNSPATTEADPWASSPTAWAQALNPSEPPF